MSKVSVFRVILVRIQSKCWKIRTKITPITDTFYAVQGNNFCLKWSFFVLKQNDINKKSQKFTCKPQLTYFICSLACMTSLTSRYSLITQLHKLVKNGHKFASSWKTPLNFIIGGFFSIKLTRNVIKTRGEMFYTFAGMASLTLNSKLCNFKNLWNLIKMPQNLSQSSFSIQLTKILFKFIMKFKP